MKALLIILLFLPHPLSVLAAITINEVAWMGSVTSPNHEWIELYNSGGAVEVAGWVLSDGNNLSIPLSGTIPAGSYIVLERTSEDSAPGNAFLIYTGALTNGGATLTLRRADTAIEDQVAGGENWQQIGGDNTSKLTAQYSSSGWFTAAASPGLINQIPLTPPPTTAATTTSPVPPTKSVSSATKLAIPVARPEPVTSLTLPNNVLTLDITAPSVGYVGQAIEFITTASGIGKTLIDSLSYEWNFGDGTEILGSGKAPTHTFVYPGTYIVTVTASYARHTTRERFEITILPVTVSLTKNIFGDVQINNDAPYELALAGYTLYGSKSVLFPEHTYLLPQQTITIAAKRLGTTHTVILKDNRKNVVATTLHETPPVVQQMANLVTPAPSMITLPRLPQSSSDLGAPFGFVATNTTPEIAPTTTLYSSDTVTSTPISTSTQTSPWPYISLLVLIAGAGFLLTQPKSIQQSTT